MSTGANEEKSSQILTQKQIIKQLKCLIAKQQQQINQLIHEVQTLKHQRKPDSDFRQNNSIAFSNLQSSRALDNGFHSKQHLSKNSSNFASVIHSKNSTNRQFKHPQTSQIEAILKDFQKYIKEFTAKVLQPFQEKYFSSAKNSHSKQKEEVLKLQTNLKQANYESLSSFARFFPHLIKQTKAILKHMDHKIEQRIQIEEGLRKKMREQEKTLKQMISEYEKNINESQKMQTKLLEEIKRLKHSHKLGFTQNFGYSNHNY